MPIQTYFIITFSLLISLIQFRSESVIESGNQEVCLSAEEMKLWKMFNAYRVSNKLPRVPLSSAMTLVAQAHANDLDENFDYQPGSECNMHSWSSNGEWTSCCYTSDHKQAECMWNKPMEIARFDAVGFENAHFNSAGATSASALEGWKKSPGHHAVMINLGQWKKVEWKAVGIGIKGKYAVMWFAEKEDVGAVVECK
jgi:uncharacterized protein YkwD